MAHFAAMLRALALAPILGLVHGIQLREAPDDSRPRLHFAPARDWMNDPNGLVYYDGEYHLYFQRTPGHKGPGMKAWGHAVSTDLLHWNQLPDALVPDQHGNNIWSGSIVVDELNTSGFHKPGHYPPMVAFFCNASMKRPFEQHMAVSHDKGLTWEWSGVPVIPGYPTDMHRNGARDPKVQWHAPTQTWIMVLFARTGIVPLFGSKDLKTWTLLQEIEFEKAFECPDFMEFPVAEDPHGKTYWVLMMANSSYVVGDFNGTYFEPFTERRFAEFGSGYAGQTFSGLRDKIQISWVKPPVGRKIDLFEEVPFYGVMSVPMKLELTRDFYIRRAPIKSIQKLRKEPPLLKHDARDPNMRFSEGAATLQSLQSTGCAMEVVVQASVPRGSALTLNFKQRDDSSVQVKVMGRNAADSKMASVSAELREMPLSISDDDVVSLHLIVDWGTLEVFDRTGPASMLLYGSNLTESRGGRCSHKTVEFQATESEAGVPAVQRAEVYELKP